MTRVTHALQIDLRFGDKPRELTDFDVGGLIGKCSSKLFDLL